MQPRPEEDESTDVFMYLLLVKLVAFVAFVWPIKWIYFPFQRGEMSIPQWFVWEFNYFQRVLFDGFNRTQLVATWGPETENKTGFQTLKLWPQNDKILNNVAAGATWSAFVFTSHTRSFTRFNLSVCGFRALHKGTSAVPWRSAHVCRVEPTQPYLFHQTSVILLLQIRSEKSPFF